MDYLDLIIDDLKHIEMFYLATDDDAAGIKLREELARRLGYERCKYIKFGDYNDKDGNPINDPNQLLIERGKAVLAGTKNYAHTFPIADVTSATEYLDNMLRNYRDGKSRGIPTGYASLDPFFNWVRGWPVVFNGFPNMGKTSLILNLIAISAVKYGWKWGIYCPENYPVENVVEIFAQILIGKPLEAGYSKRITESELIEVTKNFIDKHLYFVDHEDGFSPEKLREIKKRMVQQHGIVGFLTDPWSSLNHNVTKTGGIDEYLQNELNHEVRLTTKYNLINIICHHPKTPDKIDKPPTVWQLTGGKQWWMKMYAALCIHQEAYDDWKNNLVGLHVQKIKVKQIAGETTSSSNYPVLRYDKLSRRFYESNGVKEGTLKYDRFPFVAYLDSDQQSLFDGF
jgi:twinkle protein